MKLDHIRSCSAFVLAMAACTTQTPAPEPQGGPTVAEAQGPPSCDLCTDAACRAVDARACADRSQAYRHADGVPFDLVKHGDNAERACVHGYAPACSSIAILFQDGLGGREHSDAKAAILHKRGCEAGAGIGCFNLAMMIEGGEDGPADPERAKPLYAQAHELFTASCDAGEYEWCANLGYMHESGTGVPKDPAAAVAAYRKGCPQHANNCANLGTMMIHGEGTDKDVAGGRKLLADGCDGGSGWCCAFLGADLVAANEGDASNVEGVRRLEQGCAKKEKLACMQLAAAYGVGRGVKADPEKAFSLLETACGLGESQACRAQAEELMSRINPDRKRVLEAFAAACRISDAASCGAAALLLEKGADGKPDPERAKLLWAEGCRRGELSACDRVLLADLVPDVIASRRAEVEAHACLSGVQKACKGPIPVTQMVPGL